MAIIIPESKIQQECYIWFNNQYCTISKIPRLLIHSVPNGVSMPIPNKEKARVLDQLKKIGMVNGISDLIIHLPNGLCVMVEVKNEKNTQSPAQKKIEAKIKSMGGNYILTRSLEDFKEQIKKFIV